jgi:hypothetical protein
MRPIWARASMLSVNPPRALLPVAVARLFFSVGQGGHARACDCSASVTTVTMDSLVATHQAGGGRPLRDRIMRSFPARSIGRAEGIGGIGNH